VVPLVPKGKIGGVRRAHFAHPPGMAPAAGHSLETAWHWEVKHRLCRWASEITGTTARVEAWTADMRRRSDVAVTFPGGAKLAIEVQQGSITDTEILSRCDDYARAGTAVEWVWRPGRQIPHVLFRFGQLGWVFDRLTNRMGLACGRPHAHRPTDGTTLARIGSAHWPPCPGDNIEQRWMPLTDVQLTDAGLLPSLEIMAHLQQEAAEAVARTRYPGAVASPAPDATAPRPPVRPCQPVATTLARPHLALRIDALPPWSDPDDHFYWCPCCDFLSGTELKSGATPHYFPSPGKFITAADLDPRSYS
jgi:hypothetical protein